MCLGIPARVLELSREHPDLVAVDTAAAVAGTAGVRRTVNVGLLAQPVAPGDWVLIHLGFALELIPPEDLDEVLATFRSMGRERRADGGDPWEPAGESA